MNDSNRFLLGQLPTFPFHPSILGIQEEEGVKEVFDNNENLASHTTLPSGAQSDAGRKPAVIRNGGIPPKCVTWQEAEDTLTASIEYLSAMGDRERGYLSAGSRSGWPAIVRDLQADYADVEASPSPQLTRRCVNLVDRMLVGERPLANVIPEGHRSLVGSVIVMQRWPGPDGFGWDLVFARMGGQLYNIARRVVLPTTSEGMRKAYSRAINKLAVAMDMASVHEVGLSPVCNCQPYSPFPKKI